MPKNKGKGNQPKAAKKKFCIDCTVPVDDNVLDPASFEKFLNDRIKVNGKAGMLGDAVVVSRDKTKIHVTAEEPFSKRYLKYLTKKYLPVRISQSICNAATWRRRWTAAVDGNASASAAP